jgi:hypothetical protein
VTGNHEFYGDAETTVAEFEAGGVRWLRNARVELAPGLVLAGIEDVGRALRGGARLTTGLRARCCRPRTQRRKPRPSCSRTRRPRRSSTWRPRAASA